LDGVEQSSFYPVFKARRFAPLEKLVKEQKKYLTERTKKMAKDDIDYEFDWVENFEEYAKLTGAFPGAY